MSEFNTRNNKNTVRKKVIKKLGQTHDLKTKKDTKFLIFRRIIPQNCAPSSCSALIMFLYIHHSIRQQGRLRLLNEDKENSKGCLQEKKNTNKLLRKEWRAVPAVAGEIAHKVQRQAISIFEIVTKINRVKNDGTITLIRDQCRPRYLGCPSSIPNLIAHLLLSRIK